MDGVSLEKSPPVQYCSGYAKSRGRIEQVGKGLLTVPCVLLLLEKPPAPIAQMFSRKRVTGDPLALASFCDIGHRKIVILGVKS